MKHGLTDTKQYSMWEGMIQRCYNKNHKAYKNYGGRGILVCSYWRLNFIGFYNHIMSLPNAMNNGHTLDRKNNDGNYEPGNMQWSTRHSQMANSRIRKDNTSGYRGVSFNKGYKKWEAEISVNKERVRLGYYDLIEDAVSVRNEYIIEHNLKYEIQ